MAKTVKLMDIKILKDREKYLSELYGACSKKMVFKVLSELKDVREKIKEFEGIV